MQVRHGSGASVPPSAREGTHRRRFALFGSSPGAYNKRAIMRDPHVASLRYRFVAGETVSFDCPPPVERETEAFRMRLEDGVATFEMLEHHASEDTARECVEGYLRAWEIHVALRFGRGEMHFEFAGADVIDRDPPPPGTGQVVYAKALMGAVGLMDNVTVHVTRRRYPEPPSGFIASPDVETMWGRYEGYLKGREPLAAMAYACLTLLEASARGRESAAKQYRISLDVLRKLAHLATEIGDEGTARKFSRLRERRPHTGPERAWVEAVVKALIQRAGEWALAPAASRPQITMSDLPKL